MSGPLCLYCAERFFRYIRSRDPVTVVTVIRHPCDVIELQMLKNNFTAYPGQVFMEIACMLFCHCHQFDDIILNSKRKKPTNISFSVSTSLMTSCLTLFFTVSSPAPPFPFQYIVLNCPGVSSFENHPFTLTTVRFYTMYFSLAN